METILFVAGACVLIYIAFLLLQRQKTPQTILMTVAFGFLDYMLFYYAAAIGGYLRYAPFLIHTDLIANAGVGPTVYLFYTTCMGEGRKPVRSFMPYFAFPTLYAVVVFVMNAIVNPLPQFRPGLPIQFTSFTLMALNFIPDACFVFFFALGIAKTSTYPKRGYVRNGKGFKLMMTFQVAMLMGSFVSMMAYPSRSERFFFVALSIFAVIVTCFFLALARYPDYILGIPAKETKKYALLSAEEIAEIEKRLSGLALRTAFYRDPASNLQSIAEKVGVSPNQLSYFLNTIKGIGFREYLNDLRFESLHRDLIQNPEELILNLAMRNGFTSKSQFNALFLRKYEMTPSEFRKKIVSQKTR